jgi:hypothetical protein
MITYTQSVASQEVPPPYHFPQVNVHAFVWDASMARIEAYCDKFLNLGTDAERGFVYQPAAFWPYNLLLFIHYPVMISSSNQPPPGECPYSDRGIITQTEVFVAMPVVRVPTRRSQLLFDTEFEWALPFIVVGNPMSAVAGREMIGMSKLLAEINTPAPKFPGSFEAEVRLPGWLGPDDKQQELQFLKVTTMPALPTFRGSKPESSLWTLFQGRVGNLLMSGMGTALEVVDAVSFGLLPTAMRTVSLRQYRDANDPRTAVYQALVSCRSKYTNIDNFQFYNENDVDIEFRDKGSFGEILRYFLHMPQGSANNPTGRAHRVKPRAAFRFNADIDFDDMRTIHTFPVDRGHGLAPTPPSSDLATSLARSLRGFFGPRPS